MDGVTALAGVTASQLPALDAEAAKPAGAADVTERACGAGLALPCWNANESAAGATVNACDPLTTRFTVAICDPFDEPAAVTVMLPE